MRMVRVSPEGWGRPKKPLEQKNVIDGHVRVCLPSRRHASSIRYPRKKKRERGGTLSLHEPQKNTRLSGKGCPGRCFFWATAAMGKHSFFPHWSTLSCTVLSAVSRKYRKQKKGSPLRLERSAARIKGIEERSHGTDRKRKPDGSTKEKGVVESVLQKRNLDLLLCSLFPPDARGRRIEKEKERGKKRLILPSVARGDTVPPVL